jgi:hypothetical protein
MPQLSGASMQRRHGVAVTPLPCSAANNTALPPLYDGTATMQCSVASTLRRLYAQIERGCIQ